MIAVLSILVLCALLPPIIIYWKARFLVGGREHIAKAAEFAREGKLVEARKSVQVAINLNSALQQNPDAVSLWRIILSGSVEGQAAEIDRVHRATKEWPKTKWEVIYEDERFRTIVIVIWVLILLSRLLSLR